MYSCHAKNDLGTASTEIELFRAEVESNQPPLDLGAVDPDEPSSGGRTTSSKGISVHRRVGGEYFSSSAIALTLSFLVFLLHVAHITTNDAQYTLRLAEFW